MGSKMQQKHEQVKALVQDVLGFGDLLLVSEKSHGKTESLKTLASEFRRQGCRVIIFEDFPKWINEFESIPFTRIRDKDIVETSHTVDIEDVFLRHERSYTVLRGNEIREALERHKDMIFLLQTESIEKSAFLIYSIVRYFYRRAYLRAYKGYKKFEKVVFIVEESQNVFDSSTISKKIFNKLRKLFSTARNLGLHFVMATQRMQDLNTKIRGRTRLMLGRVSLDDYQLKIYRLLRFSMYRKEILDFKQGEWLFVATDSKIKFPLLSQQKHKPFEINKPSPNPKPKTKKVSKLRIFLTSIGILSPKFEGKEGLKVEEEDIETEEEEKGLLFLEELED